MQTKAYFASSVPAALEVARHELGENALLVSSRPAPPDVRQLGKLEVTFAWDPKQEPRQPAEALPARKMPAPSPINAPVSEMDEIRRQLSALHVAVNRGGQFAGANGANSAAANLSTEADLTVEKLVEAGFSRATAAAIGAGAERRSGTSDDAVLQEIANRIPVAPFVAMKPGESRTLAFIGPPGRGKTTSLIKIAVDLGLALRVPVRIYCAGAHCVGAQEQLARFASILGTPYLACESLASLNLALNGEAWKGLALIDTPGLSPADRHETSELKGFFAARPEIEKHLVLRADASSADMLHMIGRFSSFTPSRLLFTGLDEAIGVAPLIEALISGNIPATFAGTGQRIPEDLEDMNAERLARAVWSESAVGAVTGANEKFAQAAA
jgi:flagellar biosynthesis protein FlhF